jgi:hypothetical protein
MELVKGTKSISPCPDRWQFPQLESSVHRCNAYKKGHVNQSSQPQRETQNQRARSTWAPQRRDAPMSDSSPHFFLYVGVASGSRVTAGPTVWTHHYIPELLLEIYKQSMYMSRHPLDRGT